MIHSINKFQLPGKMPCLGLNTKRSACLDNKVGQIVYNGKRFEGFNGGKSDFGLQRNSNATPTVAKIQKREEINYLKPPNIVNPRIVILIESPHKDEYKPKNKTGVSGPAMGASGDRFNGQAITVFNKNISTIQNALGINANVTSKITYDVYFVNAIQYQCSLGYEPIKPELRDFIFESLWNRQPNSFKDDLIERLNIIKPNLIINACTKELQKTCCNGNNIIPDLTGFNFSFLTASDHICVWDNNTIIL